MQIIKLNIDDIKPYKNNAKIHTAEQIEQIKNSILEFKYNDPIAIWGDENIIVEGHGRFQALKELGYKEIECIRLDHLTDDERRAYTLAHNQLTMNTGFDNLLLDEELRKLLNIDMRKFGFEPVDLTEDDIKEDDFEYQIEPEKDAIAKPRIYIYMRFS
jgi:ParB-like chromosome segregation protein Spo0J